MSPSTQLSRRLRWAVPAGVVAAAGGVVAASVLSAAQATPALPQRTPAQLLAALAGQPGPPPPLTGTLVETASLGLPSLPDTGDPTSLQALLTGSHTVRVWYADPQHFRLAIPGQLSETDVIRNGSNMWTWSSVHNTATHTVLPGLREPAPEQVPMAPQQAAREVLAAVGPTTQVSVATNVMVAGQPCYQLDLAPKDSRSLVGQIRIAVDARHNVPLRVQVFARDNLGAPAFQTGFTSLAYTRPAAANFAFKPPPGSKVVQGNVMPGPLLRRRAQIEVVPPGAAIPPGAVMVPPGANLHRAVTLPKGAKLHREILMPGQPNPPGAITVPRGVQVVIGPAPPGVPRFNPMPFPGLPGRVLPTTVVGKGWLAVAVIPAGGPDIPGGNSVNDSQLRALLGSASPVRGNWGSGRLLRTKLLSVLISDDGRLFIGAVTPGVLYSAAQKLHVTGDHHQPGPVR